MEGLLPHVGAIVHCILDPEFGRHATTQCTAPLQDVLHMVSNSRFDSTTKEWVYYAPPSRGLRQRLDQESIVAKIAVPLLKVFVGRRWPTAALSRCFGVMTCLKRVALGTLMNCILPDALALLSDRLSLTEQSVQQQAADNIQRAMAGQEVDTNRVLHDSRIVKLSKYFGDNEQQWKIVVILKSACIVDKLHWTILGKGARMQPADLHSLVDPAVSKVAETQSSCLHHLQDWNLTGTWSLLGFFGVSDVSDTSIMSFARKALLQVSSALFLRMELRFAAWPYRLQWLLSENTTAAEQHDIAVEFVSADECCLGSFAKQLRKVYDTVDVIQGEECKSVLLLWAKLIKFNTADVEREHKQFADSVRSQTSGCTHGPACWQTVCRHLQQAHLARGGQDCSLPWTRVRKQQVAAAAIKVLPLAGGSAPLVLGDREPPLAQRPPDAVPSHRQSLDAMVSSLTSLGVGGGNPKFMFMNYKVRSFKDLHQGRALTKAENDVVKKAAMAEYDQSPSLRDRWSTIFRILSQRNRQQAQRQQPEPSDPVVAQHAVVWPAVMQEPDDASARLPIGPTPLANCKAHLAPSTKQLHALAQDPVPFQVTQSEVKDRPCCDASPIWGCPCQYHNVCKAKVASVTSTCFR